MPRSVLAAVQRAPQSPPLIETLTLADPRADEIRVAMRAVGIEAFEYRSARCPDGGGNIALYVPAAFAEKRPRNLTAWLCETTGEYVAFKHAQTPDQPRLFHREQFLVQGQLPRPA